MSDLAPTQGRAALNLKSVALPVEHGGWGMLGEPLLLGLLVAPSWAGLGVGVAALGAFLAHHPLRIALADWRRGSAYPRTAAARRFALLYAATAAAGLALAGSGRSGWWLPLAASAPLALTQLAYDAGHRGRQLLPQLLGSIALSSVVAAEMRAGGLGWGLSLAAGALAAAKAVGAVLYVRTRLRQDRGLAPSRSAPLGAHAGGLLLAVALAGSGYTPWLTSLAFILLLARRLRSLPTPGARATAGGGPAGDGLRPHVRADPGPGLRAPLTPPSYGGDGRAIGSGTP